ncbi:hypothetical protein CJ745_20030 [Salmonella enterica subsp. enterica]|uniref:hypothetical protein n=1 Tax=Salmonella enterica TaxID=28901 RepID=UPI0012F3E3C6|nr:hypothetical protein [Salmonella enterica]EAW1476871.1 hypothetical protein [Salmonella enterica subsp. enterica]EBT4151278.1 hypothetical protein [Salmonella enterica subsp. enterica]EED9464870.1 hypothetical protein [Salmonella enterica subsp. enterica serovar Abaetetuba]MCT7050941.1 hypothetical protein [Salmonella enterica subsp. enterica serovar Give]
MLKYFLLRAPQAMLILSFSLPLALALSLEPSFSGLINTSMLGLYGIGITAAIWLSLAYLTRNSDRCRRLSDSPEITIFNGKQVAARMKEHEKAEIVWQVLQDDSLYYRLTGLWWRSMYHCLGYAILRGPLLMLLALGLACWLAPDYVAVMVQDWFALSVKQQVFATGALMSTGYMITVMVWIFYQAIALKQREEPGFRSVYLERVQQFSRTNQMSDAAHTDNTVRISDDSSR